MLKGFQPKAHIAKEDERPNPEQQSVQRDECASKKTMEMALKSTLDWA